MSSKAGSSRTSRDLTSEFEYFQFSDGYVAWKGLKDRDELSFVIMKFENHHYVHLMLLLEGERASAKLRAALQPRVVMTTKLRPSDVDVVFVPPAEADTNTWGLLAFSQRSCLKDLHKVDLWPWPSPQRDASAASGHQTIRQFFASDEDDYDKGLIVLEGIHR